MSKFRLFAATLLCCMLIPAVAQTPYSQYGYGTLDDNATGNQRAMGSTGIGMRNNLQINMMNPASYTAIDSLTFMFDFSLDYKASWFKEGSAQNETQGGGLNYFAMQFRLGKTVAGSIGLTPLSHVQYTYGNSLPNGSYTRIGEGGLSQAYLGVAYQPWSWVSVGVNVGYMFGKIQNYIQVATNPSTGGYYKTMSVNDIRLQAGLQFPIALDKKNDVILGLTYTLGKPTHGQVLAYATYSDTTTYNMKELYSMPHCFGAGLSYTHDKRLTIAADARYDMWEDAKFYNPNTESYEPMNNRMRLSAGVEYRPKLLSSSYFDYIRYRAGGFYEESYIKVGNNSVREWGVTAGLGFPLRSDKSILNVSFEYSHRNGYPTTLLSEDHFAIVISMTFNEMWFWQRKFE
ncbi:MAG: hypothetical protein J6J06_05680 [Bacteroidaceae bacterium]|nr:hypothetical protein [Bacteroidaceae bacterium]